MSFVWFNEQFHHLKTVQRQEINSFWSGERRPRLSKTSNESCLLVELSEPLFEIKDNRVRGMWKMRNAPKEKYQNDFQLVSLLLIIPGSRCPVYTLVVIIEGVVERKLLEEISRKTAKNRERSRTRKPV